MVTRRESCLFEVEKRGLLLRYDPPGFGNRCFYSCLGRFLGLDERSVIDMVEKYMLENRFLPVANEHGELVNTDLHLYLSDADFEKLKGRPETWADSVLALRDEMTTHAVILASSYLFSVELIIINWKGELVKTKPGKQEIKNQIYLAYTGDHYMLLKQEHAKNNPGEVVVISDSDTSPEKASCTMKRKTGQVNDLWAQDLTSDSYNPGISVFKGIKYDVTKVNLEKMKDEKQESSKLRGVIEVFSDSEEEHSHSDQERTGVFKTKQEMDHAMDCNDHGTGYSSTSSDSSGRAKRHAKKSRKYTSAMTRKKVLSSGSSFEGSDDERPNKKQRKIGPSLWDGVSVVPVDRLPENIDGLKCYKVNGSAKRKSALNDGRRWQKDSQSQWKGFGNVRFSNCRGSRQCKNKECSFLKEYGVINKTQFNWKTNACKVCHQPGEYVSCPARKYVAQRCGKTFVYHCGTHTCPFMPSTERAEKDVKRIITEHPDATPAQIQSSVILSRMRKHCDWSEVEKAAASVSDKKWISNTKQEIKKSNEPRGHDFEAVAHFKEYADERDPYYVYKVKYDTGEANGQSYVFKTSKLKAKIAINMDQSKEHFLSREFCHFDGKVKRCKGFVTLSAAVYHPLLQKLIPLAVMECGAENTSNISLFWSTFNEVLRKESNDANYVFNPRGWITDMAGANIEGLKKVYGTAVTERIKTCEFHFKDCRNRQARKLDENSRSHFKRLCQALIQAESQTGYEAAKENLLDFIAQDNNHKFLQSWFEWWDRRRALIFPAFQNEQSRSKMNMAETTHASWVKRDRENLSLLDVAHADVRDNLQLELEYKNFQHGTGQGGKGPSVQVQQSKEHALQINRAHNLGRELIREDLTDSDIVGNYASPKVVSNPHDKHNASVKTGPRRSQGERNGRFRPTRSKVFLNRLQKANEEKSSIKVRDSSTTGETKCFTLVTNSSSIYRVCIGRKHFCQCMDFAKNGQNELCKHIIWVLLHVCKVPQESELLHQIFLTEAESYEILSNTPAHIPEDLRYVAGKKTQNRQDIVKNLLMNDGRNVKPKIWILKKKEKQRGTTPRCRNCRKEQPDGDLTITVTGLYVPYEQNFVVETVFYFCPNSICIKRIPPWINLTPPSKINVHNSVSIEELNNLKKCDHTLGALLTSS